MPSVAAAAGAGAERGTGTGTSAGIGSRLSPAGWSLRTRIVAALAVTVVLLSGAIAAIALTTLRVSLVQQLDSELRDLSARAMFAISGPANGIQDPGQALDGPGTRAGSLMIVSGSGGGVSGVYLDDAYGVEALSEAQVSDMLTGWSDERIRDFSVGGGLGDYRLAVEHRGETTVIVGLPLAAVEQTVSAIGLTMGAVTIGGCLLLGALAAWYIRHELRPLERVAETAEEIADTPLERGNVELRRVADAAPGSAHEVRRLVSGFNSMIDQVARAFRVREESEATVRRFVADASHELRTPLASIRGYSEFTRRFSAELPEDAGYALDRIESESVRMTGLVEDLLLLARLDEGQELTFSEVDLGDLAADAVNDARMLGPDHAWSLGEPETPVSVLGDGRRLQQVIVNLLSNARVHTPAGTSVEVVLSTCEGQAVLEVADDGPGIPENVQSELFERFARGDASRARATGSTGLGLAIVRAIIEGHGGEVDVASAPGSTRFTVRLPLAPATSGYPPE